MSTSYHALLRRHGSLKISLTTSLLHALVHGTLSHCPTEHCPISQSWPNDVSSNMQTMATQYFLFDLLTLITSTVYYIK